MERISLRSLRERIAVACAVLAMLSLGVRAPSDAATVTNTTAISANIAASCAINSVTSPATEALTSGSAAASESGSVSVSCTNAWGYNLEFNAGTHGTDGATPTRYVANGANLLQYQLYKDAGLTQPWGDTVGTNTVAQTGTGGAQGFTFYLQFTTPSWTLPTGSYTDTVTITVAY